MKTKNMRFNSIEEFAAHFGIVTPKAPSVGNYMEVTRRIEGAQRAMSFASANKFAKDLNRLQKTLPKFAHSFTPSEGEFLVLWGSVVTSAKNFEYRAYSKKHSNGWTVCAIPHEDYYVWVNNFIATHPKLGVVCGNYEKPYLSATNLTAFDDFVANFAPRSFDYDDI